MIFRHPGIFGLLGHALSSFSVARAHWLHGQGLAVSLPDWEAPHG